MGLKNIDTGLPDGGLANLTSLVEPYLIESGSEYVTDNLFELNSEDETRLAKEDYPITLSGVNVGPQDQSGTVNVDWSLVNDVPSSTSNVSVAQSANPGQLNDDTMFFLLEVDLDKINTVDMYHYNAGSGNQLRVGYFDTADVSQTGYTDMFTGNGGENGNWGEITIDFSNESGIQYFAWGSNFDSANEQRITAIQFIA